MSDGGTAAATAAAAATSSGGKKKKKPQKMNLNDFHNLSNSGNTTTANTTTTTTTARWGDQVDLPTEPASRAEDNYGSNDGGYSASASNAVIPDKPPYTAFVGNLPYEADKDTVSHFFGEENVADVRLLVSHDQRPKGFGYVEFKSADQLRAALNKNGSQMGSRNIKVDVATSNSRNNEAAPDRTMGEWLKGPSEIGSGGRDGDRYVGDRYGGDRRGGDRYGGDRYGGDRHGGDRHGGDRYGGNRSHGGGYDSRSSGQDSASTAERPKLNLSKRTLPIEAPVIVKPFESKKVEPAKPAGPQKPKSNPFGSAKPVDTAAKEKEIDARLSKEREVEPKRIFSKPSVSEENSEKAPIAGDQENSECHPESIDNALEMPKEE